MPKRDKYISWDEFFMGVAELASKRSKDPSTQHGACIVDPKTNRILSVGYNGLPKGLRDDGNFCDTLSEVQTFPTGYDYWEKPQKYEFVVHAEENAFFNANIDLSGSTIYIYSEKGYYPCSRCARGIIQNGIKEVVLKTVIKGNTPEYDWSFTKHMFKKAGIKIRVLEKYYTKSVLDIPEHRATVSSIKWITEQLILDNLFESYEVFLDEIQKICRMLKRNKKIYDFCIKKEKTLITKSDCILIRLKLLHCAEIVELRFAINKQQKENK